MLARAAPRALNRPPVGTGAALFSTFKPPGPSAERMETILLTGHRESFPNPSLSSTPSSTPSSTKHDGGLPDQPCVHLKAWGASEEGKDAVLPVLLLQVKAVE